MRGIRSKVFVDCSNGNVKVFMKSGVDFFQGYRVSRESFFLNLNNKVGFSFAVDANRVRFIM